MTVQLHPRERDGGAASCAYCHDLLGAAPTRCGGCGAEYHAECRIELGRCATLGCSAGVAPRAAPAPQPRIEGLGRGAALTLCLLAAGAAAVLAVADALQALVTGTRPESLPHGPWPALCVGSLFLCVVIPGLGIVAREGLQALRRRPRRAVPKQGQG